MLGKWPAPRRNESGHGWQGGAVVIEEAVGNEATPDDLLQYWVRKMQAGK